MDHNLSNKLCIKNSVVVHLGMKLLVTCIYFHSTQNDFKFLKEFEIKKKKKGIKHTYTCMLNWAYFSLLLY